MKATLNLRNALGFTAILVASAALFSSANISAHSNPVQTVTISAKRMTVDEKIAFDLQNQTSVQTVVITAKRIPPEQRLAVFKGQAPAHIEVAI